MNIVSQKDGFTSGQIFRTVIEIGNDSVLEMGVLGHYALEHREDFIPQLFHILDTAAPYVRNRRYFGSCLDVQDARSGLLRHCRSVQCVKTELRGQLYASVGSPTVAVPFLGLEAVQR